MNDIKILYIYKNILGDIKKEIFTLKQIEEYGINYLINKNNKILSREIVKDI